MEINTQYSHDDAREGKQSALKQSGYNITGFFSNPMEVIVFFVMDIKLKLKLYSFLS